MDQSYLTDVIQVAIGVVFLRAAVGKVFHPRAFAAALRSYAVVPDWSGGVLAVLVAWVELGIAVGHLFSLYTRPAAATGAMLLTVFGAAVLVNLRRGRAIPCYCFSTADEKPMSTASVVRIVVMLAAELTLVLDMTPGRSPWTGIATPLEAVLFGSWVVAALNLGAWAVVAPAAAGLIAKHVFRMRAVRGA